MTLITSSIPNLINGISQQPPTLRLASQAEGQVNFLSSVADGLTVRPPTRHLAILDNADWSDAFLHTINRDVTERYLVAIRDGTLRVFEAETGVERTVTAPDGWDYLAGGSSDDYRAVTVADYTFVLNRKTAVQIDPTTSAARTNSALLVVTAGNYGKKFKVFIDGIERAYYLTPDGSVASHANNVDTSYIAEELYNDLVSWGGAGFNFTLTGNQILIHRADTTEFKVRVEDGSGGVNMIALQERVQRFSDLPEQAPHGFTLEIVGDQSSQFDNYHVRFENDQKPTVILNDLPDAAFTATARDGDPSVVLDRNTSTRYYVNSFTGGGEGGQPSSQLEYVRVDMNKERPLTSVKFRSGPEANAFTGAVVTLQDGLGNNVHTFPAIGTTAINTDVTLTPDSVKNVRYIRIQRQGTLSLAEVTVTGEDLSETAPATGSGVWKETLKGNETFRANNATMPHTLVREADGTFTFSRPKWTPREVGDLEKVPHPSFEDRAIRDIFFFKNRLGLIADENVILSQDGKYFDFYRSTATALLDTDPIDVAVTSSRVSILNFAVPFNQSLLLFSDQVQFVLEGGSVLSPQTASVTQATAFESLTNVRPVGVGQFVYFPVPRGSYAGLREYFVQEGNEQNDALDVTSHVPRYLPRSLTQMAASSSEDTLVALADSEKNAIWIYRFFFNSEGKLQSAWSKWALSSEDSILSVSFIESQLYLVVVRGSQTFIDTISLESGNTDPGSTMSFRVDRGVRSEDCEVTFDGMDTTITLPFATSEELYVVARGDDENYPEGLIIPYDRPSDLQVVLRGDWSTAKLMIGQRFVATYHFSPFYMRSSEPGGGVSANADGRLQLRYLSLDYSRTGFFKLISKPRGRDAMERVFSGRILGVESGTLGTFNLATGRFRTPIMCRNYDADIQIVCDSPLPASFTAAEWEATFTSRARKV